MTKAWLLTSPAPKSHWYETWRFMGEMKKRGLDTIHINPSMWKFNGQELFINDSKLEQPDVIMLRHAVWNTRPLKHVKTFLDRGTYICNPLLPHIDALDKVTSQPKYIAAKIPMPKTEIIDFNDDLAIDIIDDKIGWPCVIKWRFAAGSERVYLCHNPEEVYAVAKELINTHRGRIVRPHYATGNIPLTHDIDLKVIAQEYLHLDYMFRVHAIRGRHILPNMQIHGLSLKGYDKFKGNFSSIGTDNPPDGRMTLATKAPEEMRIMVENILDALGLQWGGIDLFPSKDGFMLCEVNPTANIVMAEAASLKNITGMMIDHMLEGYRSNRY
jgi:glutathione synthase/RimK-type ligase-like ATP-grasp enzyme